MTHQRISAVLLCVAIVAMALAGCGDDDNATTASAPDDQTTIGATTTSTIEATSTSATDVGTSSTAAGGPATVESLLAAVQAGLDEEFAAAPDPPPEVLGAIELSCDRSGPLRAGDLLACLGTPRTEPGFELDRVGVLFAILDNAGTAAWTTGTDLPSNDLALRQLATSATPDLFCRDLVDPDAQAQSGFFDATTTTESLGYLLSVVYWFIEDRPDRMDEDGNGIPCETVHDAAVVEAIWRGGEVG